MSGVAARAGRGASAGRVNELRGRSRPVVDSARAPGSVPPYWVTGVTVYCMVAVPSSFWAPRMPTFQVVFS